MCDNKKVGEGVAMVARPLTVGETLDNAITECNHNLVRLMNLRATAQARGLLDLPQDLMGQLTYPTHPF